MREFFLLAKIEVMDTFGINKIIYEKNWSKKLESLFKLILMIAVFGFLFFSFYIFANELISDIMQGNEDALNQILGNDIIKGVFGNDIKSAVLGLVLIIFAIMSSFMLFIRSIYSVQTSIFKSKDYELLLPMPIPRGVILGAKIFITLIGEYFFSALILFPVYALYYNVTGGGIISILRFILAFLLLPLVPITLGSFVVIIFSYLGSLFRRFKNFITIILSFGFIFLIFYMTRAMQNHIITSLLFVGTIPRLAKTYYPVAYYFSEVITNFNFTNLIMYVLHTAVPFIIFMIICGGLFEKVRSNLLNNNVKSNYKFGEMGVRSPMVALVRRELKRYFSSSIYVINTMFALIMMVVLTGYVMFAGGESALNLFELGELSSFIGPMLLIAISFCTLFSCMTNCSISLEGNTLWLAKTMPITEKDILMAKVHANLILQLPISYICLGLLSYKLELGLYNFILYAIIITIITTLGDMIGIISNLYFPKFDWKNETVVVKQSMSVFMHLVIVLIVFALAILLNIIVLNMPIDTYLRLVALFSLALCVISYIFINTKGTKLYQNIIN